jgi:glycosidase
MSQQILDHLTFLYGAERAQAVNSQLTAILRSFEVSNPNLADRKSNSRFSEQDSILITYGDMVQAPDQKPLATLANFLQSTIADVVSTVHILPFFPYSSDDGFSIIDYEQVDPQLGDWEDVAQIGHSFRLMFDAVVNHISAESDWFQAFLQDDPRYRDYFIRVSPDTDLTAVFRPRALPLLTQVETGTGPQHVWTTFSEDQIDLNFANPDTLLDVIRVLLLYVAHGAEFIRLDAIAYIWKEIGTSCIHLPQTHVIIQLIRTVLDAVAPHVALITETNVPHRDNISYFGDGHNEAQMVYNFSLPPLTLHAFHTGQATELSQWAATLKAPSDETTFFNFLASHDGIGVTPAKGILSETAVLNMAARVEQLGGYVSYRSQPDGSQSPYELNINYLDALGDPTQLNEDIRLVARRFLASQAIMLALQGVPGIYFHSLFGSRNWIEGVAQTGRRRTINRQKLTANVLKRELVTKNHLRKLVFTGYKNLLAQRHQQAAFHPNSSQEILSCHDSVFALLRKAENGRSTILCLHNVANKPVQIELEPTILSIFNGTHQDIISGKHFQNSQLQTLTLTPYQCLWLEK